MFKKIILIFLLFNISFVFADSLIIDTESEFNNGSYENTYFSEEFTYSESVEDSYTKLLMHFEDFSDEISHTPTENGDVSINTGKFSNGAYFDGDGDYIEIPDSEDWNFGTGDFTIDFWIKFSTLDIAERILWIDDSYSVRWGQLALDYEKPNNAWYLGLGDSLYSFSDSNVEIGNWYHITLVRNGNNVNLYKNGELINTISSSNSITGGNLRIGSFDDPDSFYLGAQLDELRISKGIARWTFNFQPPNQEYYEYYNEKKSSVKLFEGYEDTYTKLLMHMEDSTDSIDAHTPTVSGAIISTGKYSSGYSFDGINDYISIPDSTDWDFGTSDFTIDFWTKLNDLEESTFLSFTPDAGGGDFMYLRFMPGEGIQYRTKEADGATSFVDMNQGTQNGWEINQWYHIALVRNGNIWSIYKDGIEVATTTDSDQFPVYSTNFIVGYLSQFNQWYLNGTMDELRISKGIARWTSDFVPPPREYKIDNTKLLLHFDGPDESQTHFYDSSPSKHSLTINGNTKLEASEKMFGESSAYFDGTGDYIIIPDSDDWHFGSEDFTIEFWTNPKNLNGDETFWVQRPSGIDVVGMISTDSIGTYDFRLVVGSTIQILLTGKLNLNQWNHIALTRKGDTWLLFTNGNKSDEQIRSYAYPNYNANVQLGYRNIGNYFEGYLDELKIIKGKALYTSNFTPNNYQYYNNLNGVYQSQVFDMSSEVNWKNISWLSNLYEDIQIDSNTKLLLHFNNGDESTSFTDDSYSRHTITAYNGAKQENSDSKFGITSGYFDGTDDYLLIPDSEDWNFGNGPFTIDFWMKTPTTTRANHFYILDKGYNKVGDDGNYAVSLNSDLSAIWFWSWDEQTNSEGNQINYNFYTDSWYHIAFVKEGTTVKGFIDGDLLQTSTVTKALGDNNEPLLVAKTNPSLAGNYQGYIDELRIVKGKAIWTNNFTPPNQEYYKDNTNLLLQFDQGDESTNFIDSSNYNRTITSFGNAKQENTIKRFGESAGYFDGSGDYLTLPDSTDWDLFTGEDFTIDGWVKHNSVGGGGSSAWDYSYLQHFSSGTSRWIFGHGWNGISNNGIYAGIVNGDWTLYLIAPSNAGMMTDTNWHHLALTKKSGTYYMFKDGKLLTSSSSAVTFNTAGNLYVGQRGNGYDYFNGYMDEWRVIKGEAKWTSNFEPPNEKYYSNLNEMEMQVRTCTNADCLDGIWTTNTDLSTVSSQYIQFQTYFGTQDISFNPELFNVSLNYIGSLIEPEIPIDLQYFVSPTPKNKSNLMTNEVIINITSSSTLSNCILHINNQNHTMTNHGTYCTQNFSNFNSNIEDFYYNVTFTENSETKTTENRMFTYYPDYSEEAMPATGLISGLITILIIIGGLFI